MARRSRPFILLALAVLSGGAAAYLAMQYIRQQATPLMAATPKNPHVVVAAHSLPLGTVLGERDVKTVEWAGGALPPGFLPSAAEAVGRGLIVPVQENEPILDAKLAPKGAGGGLPVIIDQGKRALTMRVNDVSAWPGSSRPTRGWTCCSPSTTRSRHHGAVHPDHHAGRAGPRGRPADPAGQGRKAAIGRGGHLSADARAGGNTGAGLEPGNISVGAAQLDGHHAHQDVRHEGERAHGRADRPAVARAGPGPPAARRRPRSARSPARRSSRCTEAAPARCRSFSRGAGPRSTPADRSAVTSLWSVGRSCRVGASPCLSLPLPGRRSGPEDRQPGRAGDLGVQGRPRYCW